MADKYTRTGSNGSDLEEIEATTESTGAGEAGRIIALGATGKLDESMLPTGIGADTKLIEASESLAAGDFVNVFDDAGTLKVRKADATTAGKEANGFVLSSATGGNNANVYFTGINDALSGLTPGAIHYLGTTAGAVTTTRPSTSNNIIQRVGRALSATELAFFPGNTIRVA